MPSTLRELSAFSARRCDRSTPQLLTMSPVPAVVGEEAALARTSSLGPAQDALLNATLLVRACLLRRELLEGLSPSLCMKGHWMF